MARCFTGWTIGNPRQDGEFFFNPRSADDGEKIVLERIPAGGGMKDAETVIRILAPTLRRRGSFRPNSRASSSRTSRRLPLSIGRRRPSPDRWRYSTGRAHDPDLARVLGCRQFRAKIKTPFEMTVSAVRAVGAETNGGPALHRWIAQMGEPLYLAQPDRLR